MDINFSSDNVRNPAYNANGLINLEINHPEYGWIPYTLDTEDVDNTIDNEKLLKYITDSMSVAEYVEPDIPPQGEEVADIIESL